MLRTISRASALLAALFAAACSSNAGSDGSSAGLQKTAHRPAPVSVVDAGSKAPHAKSIVIVIMENRDYDLVIGSPDAPYINNTLVPQAALMTNSHAIGHPSQPNYLALFSGNTQGVIDDSCPHTFTVNDIGAELLKKDLTFTGYSESMPSNGYTGCDSGEYARKHNPWVNFTNIPAKSNLIYKSFPKSVPTLSIFVPNLCNDMHDCNTQTGDTWLKENAPAILSYNAANDGLFILTWDEADPDANGTNQIPTLLIGPMIKPGSYSQEITHYSVLRTIDTITGVKCIDLDCKAPYLKGMWQ